MPNILYSIPLADFMMPESLTLPYLFAVFSPQMSVTGNTVFILFINIVINAPDLVYLIISCLIFPVPAL